MQNKKSDILNFALSFYILIFAFCIINYEYKIKH
jgi:hypothetical protein